jgi:hypothetical protein
MSRQEIQAALALRERENFEARYFKPTLASASPPKAAPCLKLSIRPHENIFLLTRCFTSIDCQQIADYSSGMVNIATNQ